MTRLRILFLSFLTSAAFAQTGYGIKGGLNISDVVMTNYVNPDMESGLNLKLGLHAGAYVTGMVNERMGMSAELLYSDKGVKGSSDIHLRYISLPLMMYYRLADHIFGELGPEPAYLFATGSKYGSVSGTYNNKFDLSLDGGLRFDAGNWLFGIRYCAGLFSVRDPEPLMAGTGKDQIKYQNRVLQLWLGYRLWKLE
ncbi:MAG TPA: porin family protein [Chryseosolibacter sp.]